MAGDTLDLQAKWDARYADGDPAAASPPRVLSDHEHLLPAEGRVLDLACGLGGAATFLARRGFDVHAWDLSQVAIERLTAHAEVHSLRISAAVRDCIADPPAPSSFDVIVVANFLQRDLAPALMQALRGGGLLFYQTFIRDKVSAEGPSNPDFLLQPNELLHMFDELLLLAYREEGSQGDAARGFRNQAMLVGRRG